MYLSRYVCMFIGNIFRTFRKKSDSREMTLKSISNGMTQAQVNLTIS